MDANVIAIISEHSFIKIKFNVRALARRFAATLRLHAR